MNDLERFFRRLVTALAETDPARLRRPIPIADIQQRILPYRTNRHALGVDTSEDYEALLLRLCAGEGGYARTDPAEIQARFRTELEGSNPDLALLRQHGDALVSLSPSAIAGALGADPQAAYAPPAASGPPAPALQFSEETPGTVPYDTPPRSHPAAEVEPPAETVAPMCFYCGGLLPVGRTVNFCPHCGQRQTSLRCLECMAEVELGWRHCITCGAALEDP